MRKKMTKSNRILVPNMRSRNGCFGVAAAGTEGPNYAQIPKDDAELLLELLRVIRSEQALFLYYASLLDISEERWAELEQHLLDGG